ncbi:MULTISPECIES: aldo/keto reductase [unclassified Brenneria]|uniref:aldo/keto reductase n=1 Tax=unclassified Brenneria TaxID=2634434 RepID=UPI001555C080|nr:aldo/keto reductase [Brenneria sp. hezel4-2-4]MEE3649342.1 aldo/keto reductase [Brenneria sp. HEZEL_4_2_4]NPC99297.1 aldo/keto reductase [Brenneria sp. hezel4-2-4]
MAMRDVSFPDGTKVPAVGQGTWYMGENSRTKDQEVKALQAGIDQGMTLIDTAEMYAEGGAEIVVGEAIRGRRDKVYLVSKVYPHNAGGGKAIKACEQSLKRLQTDHIDLYLLHWRGGIPLIDTITAMQQLQQSGKIGRWGVSNLDTDDMQELWSLDGGNACMTDQVLYHLASRGIEFDLLPWCRQRHVPVMAYCPIAQAGRLRDGLFADPVVNAIARQHAITPAQVLLAWVIRQPGVIAIPKASSEQHVKENAQVMDIVLQPDELALLDRAFPPPQRKQHLDVV